MGSGVSKDLLFLLPLRTCRGSSRVSLTTVGAFLLRSGTDDGPCITRKSVPLCAITTCRGVALARSVKAALCQLGQIAERSPGLLKHP